MPLRADSKYPSRRAYAVKFRGDATSQAPVDRIESLVSGRQRECTSGGDCLTCFARDLLEHVNESPADCTGNEQ